MGIRSPSHAPLLVLRGHRPHSSVRPADRAGMLPPPLRALGGKSGVTSRRFSDGKSNKCNTALPV